MNFLGVGPAELIVILVVALIFVGPERLPKLAADIARTIREVRQYTGSLAAEFNEVVKDFEKETEGERSSWKEIGDGLTGATQSVTNAIREARADAVGTRPSTAPPSTAPVITAPPSDEASIAAEWPEIDDTPPPDLAPGARAAANGNGRVATPIPAPPEETR